TYAWGRGFAVSGGEHITFTNVTAYNTSAAGVFVATEASQFVTRPVSDVEVLGGTLVDSNTDRTLCARPDNPCMDNGAVLVWNDNPGATIDDVVVDGLAITDTNVQA